MDYATAVFEARRLIKRSEEDQWRLAELTWEQIEAGRSKSQWGRDIGVSEAEVRRLYKIWNRWNSTSRSQRSARPAQWRKQVYQTRSNWMPQGRPILNNRPSARSATCPLNVRLRWPAN